MAVQSAFASAASTLLNSLSPTRVFSVWFVRLWLWLRLPLSVATLILSIRFEVHQLMTSHLFETRGMAPLSRILNLPPSFFFFWYGFFCDLKGVHVSFDDLFHYACSIWNTSCLLVNLLVFFFTCEEVERPWCSSDSKRMTLKIMRFVLQQSTDPDYFQALLSCISLFSPRLMQFFCVRVSPATRAAQVSRPGNPQHMDHITNSSTGVRHVIACQKNMHFNWPEISGTRKNSKRGPNMGKKPRQMRPRTGIHRIARPNREWQLNNATMAL